MNKSDEIAELIARVAIGDQKAFRQLYDRTSSKLFGVCLRILKDRSDAEAVLQEVYVKVWHKSQQFAVGKAAGITWLASIARNRAIDAYRARKPSSVDIDEMFDLADGAPSPEAAAITNSENQRVNNCLDELDEKHAQIVKHTYLSGWSYQQAADYADVPLNTAKTWIRRSLLSLRDCLNR